MLLKAVNWVVAEVLRMDPSSRLGETVAFFIYDSVKIALLLVAMIFVIGVVRTFVPEEKMRRWMSSSGLKGHFLAALLGAITPFCSCSSIPFFFAFLRAGVPLGVLFSFLITSPMIDQYILALMLGFFGWKITLAYFVSGMVMGVVGGMFLGRMQLEKYVERDFKANGNSSEMVFSDWKGRFRFAWHEALSIIKRTGIWIFVGVGIGAIVHNYVPKEAIDGIVRSTGIFSVPLAVLLGVPMYASCAAIVPIAVVLFEKGVPLGTALAFMMAIVTLSLPEAVLLRRAMRLQLIAIFFGATTAGIIATGYIFNWLQQLIR